MNIFSNMVVVLQNVHFAILILTGLLHLMFAGAVAKDSGRLAKEKIPTCLVSGITWAFATLIGGVFTAAIYWLMHHSSFARYS